MTCRKKSVYEEIQDLKNEIATVEAFMASAVRESENLDAIVKTRPLTNAERAKADELIEYIHSKNVWLVKARKEVQSFYAPTYAS